MQVQRTMSFDVIIIGAGHNGMTAATKLANSGRKVLILESKDSPGGMAKSKELIKDFHISSLPHIINHLNPEVIKELKLIKNGLKFDNRLISTINIDPEKSPIVLRGSYGSKTEGLNNNDSKNWQSLRKRLLFQSSLLKRFINTIPLQSEKNSLGAKLKILKAGLDLRLSGKEEFQEFFRMILMCVADVLEENLEDNQLKGLVSFDSTLGMRLGPRSPTSLMGLLYFFSGEAIGHSAGQIIPKGGIGNLINAFFNSTIESGVKTKFNESVAKILIKNGKVTGVKTTSGQEYFGKSIIASTSPIKTFLELVGPTNLETGFLRQINSLRYKGNTSKLNLALDKKPLFNGLDNSLLSSRMVYAPSINHVEKNFNPSKYKQLASDPNFEIVIPSYIEPSLAPNGASVASIIIQNTPYDLKDGWDKNKETLMKRVLSKLEILSPGIGKSILSSELLTPIDIEKNYDVPGGHWHHSELQIDRMFSLRPVFGFSDYKTPLPGLYMCGAGTHPGGGVSGASGLNAAKKLISDNKN